LHQQADVAGNDHDDHDSLGDEVEADQEGNPTPGSIDAAVPFVATTKRAV